MHTYDVTGAFETLARCGAHEEGGYASALLPS